MQNEAAAYLYGLGECREARRLQECGIVYARCDSTFCPRCADWKAFQRRLALEAKWRTYSNPCVVLFRATCSLDHWWRRGIDEMRESFTWMKEYRREILDVAMPEFSGMLEVAIHIRRGRLGVVAHVHGLIDAKGRHAHLEGVHSVLWRNALSMRASVLADAMVTVEPLRNLEDFARYATKPTGSRLWPLPVARARWGESIPGVHESVSRDARLYALAFSGTHAAVHGRRLKFERRGRAA